MTFTLELPETVVEILEAEAKMQHLPLQEWIMLKLRREVDAATSSTRSQDTMSDEQFSMLARGVVNDYRVVLERLA